MRISSFLNYYTLPKLEVRNVKGKGKGVFVRRSIPAMSLVCIGRPTEILPARTEHSFQVDWERHVELDAPARLINHSCEPNLGIRNNEFGGYSFIALRDIAAGEELCWNYGMTEAISIAVGQCRCGSSRCAGRSRGFTELPLSEQELLLNDGVARYLASWHLKQRRELSVLRA